VPVAERLAAVQTLEGLQQKYRDFNQQKLTGAAPSNLQPRPTGGLTPAEQAELESLRKALGR
jgi:hypothetical protein